jgi:hypothetical protein
MTTPRFRRFVHSRRSVTEAFHFAGTVPLLLRGYRFDVIECDEFPYMHFPFVYLATRFGAHAHCEWMVGVLG